MIYIILLAIIQGITEFLPISSSAHLVIFHKILNNMDNYLILDIGLHLGSLIAILIFYRGVITSNLNDFLTGKNKNNIISKASAAFLGFLPIASIVFIMIMKLDFVNSLISSLILLSVNSIIFAILLYKSDKHKMNKNLSELSLWESVSIGLYQAISLLPGVSRSGISITRGRMLGLSRNDAVEFSILLAIPTIICAGGASILKVLSEDNFVLTYSFITSIIMSFIFSYISLGLFVKYVKKFSFTPFVIYRILISIVIIGMIIFNKI